MALGVLRATPPSDRDEDKGQDELGPEAELGDEDGANQADGDSAKCSARQIRHPAVVILGYRIEPEADRQGAQDDDEVSRDLPAKVSLKIRGVAI